jgi:hypothetical protein
MVDMLQIGAHFGAQPTLGDRMMGVCIKIDCPAIFDFGDNPASIRTIVGTGPMNELDGHDPLRFL